MTQLKLFCISGLLFLSLSLFAQFNVKWIENEPNPAFPYGQLNPQAPKEVADFRPMIGANICESVRRNPDGTWQDTLPMLWNFHYVMNGTAIQDEVWLNDGTYAGSIRQFHPDSAQWVITYFSYPNVPYQPGVWHGGREGEELIFKQTQKSPGGQDGFTRLRFYDINFYEFKWSGTWVSADGSVEYPFWTISCKKKE